MQRGLKDATRAECCPQWEALPRKIKCFEPDICAELKQLVKRHKRAFTRRQRVLQLAEPRSRRVRFNPKCACRFDKSVEIVNLEQPVYTRTEQLSYPPVRKLLVFKQAFRHLFPQQRLSLLNRLIRKSLFSLYSRLENIQPPEEKIPITKWTKEEWKVHTKYLKKLAKHKIPPKVRGPRNPCMPYKKMKRYKKLANPKNREELEKLDWIFTPEMKHYQPSDRLKKLAEPKVRDEEALYQSLPIQISPGALTYKASPRIKELATAPEVRLGETDLKENPFSIAPNALKAKPSARVTELAEPREFENTHIRENPTLISPAALNAKASPRIIELAKPKGS